GLRQVQRVVPPRLAAAPGRLGLADPHPSAAGGGVLHQLAARTALARPRLLDRLRLARLHLLRLMAAVAVVIPASVRKELNSWTPHSGWSRRSPWSSSPSSAGSNYGPNSKWCLWSSSAVAWAAWSA